MMNFNDANTIQTTGAFMLGELEKFDPQLHEPLVDFTWGRDIDLRPDVSVADEFTSFANVGYNANGATNTQGKNWINKGTTAISGVSVDLSKTVNPLTLWGTEISYSIPELMSSVAVGRPIDTQQLIALNLKWQSDIDEQVYVGDKVLNQTGLLNSQVGTMMNVTTESGETEWEKKSVKAILEDVNSLINTVWKASGWTTCPDRLLLPPDKYSYLQSQKMDTASDTTILDYIIDKNLAKKVSNSSLQVFPCKWLGGLGASGKNRMVAYRKAYDKVRFPLVPLQKTPLEVRGIYQTTTYFGRLGVVEFPYLTTIGYADGM